MHGEPSDPLFAGGGGSGGTFDDRGNYFNEDLLLARAQGSNSGGLEPPEDRSRREGVAWGGEALMDSAGSFLNTARLVGGIRFYASGGLIFVWDARGTFLFGYVFLFVNLGISTELQSPQQ